MENLKFYIKSLGCKVNHCDADWIREKLVDNGFVYSSKEEKKDIYIVNACAVTKRASQSSRFTLNHFMRENPDAIFVLTGCFTKEDKELLSKTRKIDLILENKEKSQILSRLNRVLKKEASSLPHSCQNNFILAVSSNRTRAFVKIQEGCNSFCSYCIIPYLRGRSRSANPDDVLKVLRDLTKKNYKEVVLTGTHIGEYGLDFEKSFSFYELLAKIKNDKKINLKIRISSIEPHDLNDNIINIVLESEIFCKHFHIPMQSGDDFILEKMNRPYNSKYFKELILKIKNQDKGFGIGLDVIVGFPYENQESFEKTYNLLYDLPISYMHVFPFSKREGTDAYLLPQKTSPSEIKLRAKRLRDLSCEKKESFAKSFIGKRVTCLVEGYKSLKQEDVLKAMSSNYLNVFFNSNKSVVNSFVDIDVLDFQNNALFGEIT